MLGSFTRGVTGAGRFRHLGFTDFTFAIDARDTRGGTRVRSRWGLADTGDESGCGSVRSGGDEIMPLIPCWSCGADNEPCFEDCLCAKCVDPDGYDEWRYDNPEEYQDWLDRNQA